MEPKWLPKCFKNQAPVRGASGRASGSDFGRFLERQEAPQRLPRAPRERQESSRRVKMTPRRPKMTLRRPNMTPRRAKRSPRRAKVSSGRLPGAFWAGFPTHFQATRGDRDAPYSNRRRGRVAPEQGYRLALRLACFLSLPRDRARKLRKNARETHETFQLQTPGERAQRASKGCTRPTTLAILMLAMLSPRWLRGASWCFALVLLAVLCASLLAARARAARDPPHSQS